MHELLLFGQVPATRHNQVLNVLCGIAAMQPQSIHEKHLIFKPNRKPGAGAQKQVGGAQDIQKAGAQAVQAQDLFYVQLVADVPGDGIEEEKEKEEDVVMDDGKSGDGPSTEVSQELHSRSQQKPVLNLAQQTNKPSTPTNQYPAPGKWTLQFRDIPEVARQRPVTSRLINDTPITSGDPLEFMTALDYSHTSTYHLTGHRFTHLSTSILFYRIQIPTTPTTPLTNIHQTLDSKETRLLDPSGSYILQVSIRVQDGSKVETMTKGVNELMGLKEMLKGCVELEMGDRLALDTRVR